MDNDCQLKLTGKGLSEAEANELLHNMGVATAGKDSMDWEASLKAIAGELEISQEAAKSLAKRQVLLNVSAKRRIKNYAQRFKTAGEGLRAFMEGSSKSVEGARLSVDYQAKATHQKYFGRLIGEMEQAEVLQDFLSGKLDHETYLESGELGKEDGTPGVSGSPEAAKIASIIESVTGEMVNRQNRAGAYITKLPGYVVRQTHDMIAIREAGGGGNNKLSKEASLKVWSEFIMPLLDHARTFKGADPKIQLRLMHEGLYTAVHGEGTGEADIVTGFSVNVGKKASASRVLHFKDADSAFKYNMEFGTKNLRDQLFSDLFYRSRNISLMENFGPNPKAVLDKAIREIGEEMRMRDDAAEQVDSLRDWRINAAFNTISGANDFPDNHTLSRAMNTVRAVTTLSKMGATVLSAITDKGFFQSEMAFQGISGMQTMAKQITAFSSKSPEEKQMLRMMGVALDGLIGSTVSRYTMHTSVAGVGHRVQQKMFDINFMNWWTDVHKGAAAELMTGHLGDHADLPFEKLPDDLRKVLSLYDISSLEWNALRNTAWTMEGKDSKFITADKVAEIPDSVIDEMVVASEKTVTPANRLRMRDSLESRLRTYIADRVDIAVPSPGAAEKKYMTMNTQAGTPLGEAVRMLTLFKSFPVAVMNKVIARDTQGFSADALKNWLLHDSKGKFRVMQTVAMATVLGYLSGAIRDALKGRTPKELVDKDNNVNWSVLREAMARGGGAGLMGDLLLSEYDGSRKSFLNQASGPVYGGLVNPAASTISGAMRGEFRPEEFRKLTIDNTPFINLFYIRPVLDYILLWNLQEMMDPGSLQRMEKAVELRGQQHFFAKPSEQVNK